MGRWSKKDRYSLFLSRYDETCPSLHLNHSILYQGIQPCNAEFTRCKHKINSFFTKLPY